MKQIKVFKQEVFEGLADAIRSQASVAYCGQALNTNKTSNNKAIDKILAENKNQVDLFYLESILVSTGWNKNDDVFLASATWDARSTPEDKQFNFMHDENDIIGHITGSYVVDQDGNKIEGDEAPEKFDIITQAVLYNSWSNPENKDRMQQIIAEIEDGKWFVSMECIFNGFDYALINDKGEAKLIERNETSAFLTKHLRVYGGDGVYEGYKLGRALKEISFSGKGLVSRPANPRSIIFKKSVAEFNVKEITTNYIGEKQMANESELVEQLKRATAELEAARKENETIKSKAEEAKDLQIASKIKAFEGTITQNETTITTLEATVKATEAKVAELQDALTASQKQLTDTTAALSDMKKKETMQCRKASLAGIGLTEAEVTESLASLADLPDAAFEIVVAVMKKSVKEDVKAAEAAKVAAAAKAAADKAAADKAASEAAAKAKAKEGEVTPETLEGLRSAEAALVEGEEDTAGKARAAISSWFEGNLVSKNKK